MNEEKKRLQIIRKVFEYTRDNIQYDWYFNFKRDPYLVQKEREANCVDRALFLQAILDCKYEIPCRFIFANVQTKTRREDHVWPQAKYDEDSWVNLEANARRMDLDETFQIMKLKGIFPNLRAFGAPLVEEVVYSCVE